MSIVVLEAELGDAQLIADLTRASWARTVAVTSSGHRETAVQVRQHLQDGGGFIMLSGNRPIGSVRWVPVETEPNVWEILRMGVLPEYRGERLSQHLLEAVIHRALGAGVDELRLAVRGDGERLLGLYAAFGFEPAPALEYTHANFDEPVPTVMRRQLGY
jgi:GNAT superfamily N-acetyltransferase